jgi:Icc protein
MIIAQITDLHVVEKGMLWNERVPTNENLSEAVSHINSLRPLPDVIVVSGDLTEHGRQSEYTLLKEILSNFVSPVFVVPGNHDHRDEMLEIFGNMPYMQKRQPGFVNYAVDDYPIRLIGLDTSVPNKADGQLCDIRLQWLDDTLSLDREKPTLIFMHHPPFRTGIYWMDGSGLHGGRKMEEIVSRNPQIIGVVCGHIHRPIHVGWARTVASVAPSTSHQVCLQMDDSHTLDFVLEPPAVRLHVFDPGYGLVSHLSYIPRNYERLSLSASAPKEELEESVRRDRAAYENLCREEYDRPRPSEGRN